MIQAKDQLPDEATYPHLAQFLRTGGTLEVGEDFSLGAFARVRKGNRVIVVDTTYRDLVAVLTEMNSQIKNHYEQQL